MSISEHSFGFVFCLPINKIQKRFNSDLHVIHETVVAFDAETIWSLKNVIITLPSIHWPLQTRDVV